MSDDLDFGESNMVDDLLASCNQLRDKAKRLQAQVDKLQEQLAANETDWSQMALALARPLGPHAFLIRKAREYREYLERELVRNYHERAKEASYLNRLEAAFLETTRQVVYSNFGMDGTDRPEGEEVYAEKVAQEALAKIQAGDIPPQDMA